MKNFTRSSPHFISAEQWFQNGDHSKDNCASCIDSSGKPFQGEGKVVRRYRRPDDSGARPCNDCGCVMNIHGWIDVPRKGFNVCPGDWIVWDGKTYYPLHDNIFRFLFDPIQGDSHDDIA